MTASDLDGLRQALEASSGSDMASRLSRQSLVSMASRTEEGRALVNEVLSTSSELDLHLDGAGVTDHETQAVALGRFITRASTAVKEIAKDISGRRAHSSRLQVLAPAMGSVRVVLKTPEPSSTGDELPRTESDQLEDLALSRLVSLLLQAEADDDDPDGGTLEASLHGLRGETRKAVRLLSQSVLEAHWQVDGEFRPRRGRPTPVSISAQSAARLVTAANTRTDAVTTERREGLVDGWVWSEQVMTFLPNDGARVRAVAPQHLHARVAELNTEPRQQCIATFTVVTTLAPGESTSRRRSFALDGIEPVGEPATLNDALDDN